MRFIQDNLYPLLAAWLLVAAVSCWFAIELPRPVMSRTAPAEIWSLPKTVELDVKKASDVISARNLWGIVSVNAAKPPEWRVQGIASNGVESFVMLAYEGKPFELLKTGDALPDGQKILQIEKDRFFILTANKQKIAFGMYKNDSGK